MLGGLLGLAAGAVLSVRLGIRARLLAAAVLVGIAAAVSAGLALTRPERPPSQPVVRERAFEPWFRASIRVGHSEDILRAVQQGDEPVPFTEAS